MAQFRSVEEAANCLNLDHIPFCNAHLAIKRPSKYTGPTTEHGTWDDILTKVMSGEIIVRDEASAAQQPAPVVAAANATRVVELTNMVTLQDLQDENEYAEILADTKEEVSQFGVLKSVVIPRSGDYATKIYLEYDNVDSSGRAIVGLGGRTFDGNTVVAQFFDEAEFVGKVNV